MSYLQWLNFPCLNCNSDYWLRSLWCLMFCWTEKDSPRSGERRWGRKEQNHWELKDCSEDTTYEVDKYFFSHLTRSHFSLSPPCPLHIFIITPLIKPPLTLSVNLLSSSQHYVNESFKNWTPIKVIAVLVKYSLWAECTLKEIRETSAFHFGNLSFSLHFKSKCPKLLI